MARIVDVWEHGPGIDAAARYVHQVWGRAGNFDFYRDAIVHAARTPTALPRFHLLLDGEAVVGCYALLVNDLVSRQDLLPWLACLFVDERHRGRGLGGRMLAHGVAEARRIGHPRVYLTTDHDGYYERYGWTRMEDGFGPSGERGRIYWRDTAAVPGPRAWR